MNDPSTETLPETGRRLLDLVRGRLVIQGTSLNRWCADNSVTYSTAVSALTGASNGDKALDLVRRLMLAAGLPQQTEEA